MNEYHRELMRAPSFLPYTCVVPGCEKPGANHHHVVKRSQGGTAGPMISLCGSGTTGHHGLAEENRLHFRYDFAKPWRRGWSCIELAEPTKYDQALTMEGWRECQWR